MHESSSESCSPVRAVERNGSGIGSRETDRSHPSTAASHVLRARGKFQDETDPLRKAFDAFDAAECSPQGPAHSFMARCPLHNKGQRNIKVSEGADGRVLLHCYHGCQADAVVNALGLRWADLFPPGHRDGPKLKPRAPKALTAGAAFLDALYGAGWDWIANVALRCPYCDAPNAYLRVHSRGGVDVSCPDGCDGVEVRRAVETRAAIAEKGLEL